MRSNEVQLPVVGHNEGLQGSLHIEDIFQKLQQCGFSYHPVTIHVVDEHIPDDEIIEIYHAQIEKLMQEDDFCNIEVIRLQNYARDTGAYVYKPCRDSVETRLITHGKCSLFVQIEGRVIEFQCSQGDMVRIPGELCYWFEVGVHDCRYIHLYMTEEAWDRPTQRQDIQPCMNRRQAG